MYQSKQNLKPTVAVMEPSSKAATSKRTMAMVVFFGIAVLIAGQQSIVQAQAQTHHTDNDDNNDSHYIPVWVSDAASKWIKGAITDDEFLEVLGDLWQSTGSGAKEKPESSMPITEQVRAWIKDRTVWWTEERLTDEQFLDAVRHLGESGHLNAGTIAHARSPAAHATVHDAGSFALEDILLTEQEIDAITKVTKWRFVTTANNHSNFTGDKIIKDMAHVLMRDINRIYDPIFNKYRVATMSMQITQLSDPADIDKYWIAYTNQTKQDILSSAYMIASAPYDTECIFDYSDTGAVTICTREDIIMQVVIFDMYAEHYVYDAPDIEVDFTEPTTSIMDGMIRKLDIITGRDPGITDSLSHILHKTHVATGADVTDAKGAEYFAQHIQQTSNDTGGFGHDDSHLPGKIPAPRILQQEQTGHPTGTEQSPVSGVTNLVCSRDDFGTITITGSYNNDGTPRERVDVAVSFVGWDGRVMARTSVVSFTHIDGFETRGFLGHVAWDGNFAFCKASATIS